MTVTFSDDVPADVAGEPARFRMLIEGDPQVRSFACACAGRTMVLDDKHVPATFEALRGAVGKNVLFLKLA